MKVNETVTVTQLQDGYLRVTFPDHTGSGNVKHVTLKPTSQRAAAILRALSAVTEKRSE